MNNYFPATRVAGVLAALCIALPAALASDPSRSSDGAERDTLILRSQSGAHETPGDKYVPTLRRGRQTSPAYRISTGRFSSVQVNVDSLGQNIVGDAANEPSIAIDPTDPNRMAIGWRQFDTISSNFRQAGHGYTTDGGLTWRFPGVLDPGVFRSDPVLESDSEGNFYYYSLAVEPDYFCTLYKSFDGGASWDNGTYAYGGDKAWMCVDPTDGIGRDQLYFAWDYAGCCFDDWFTRSTDAGQTFDAPVPVPEEPIWGVNTTGPDGAVYVAGRRSSTNTSYIVAKSSTIQDSTNGLAFDFAAGVSLGGDHLFAIGYGPNPGGLMGQVWIAADHSTGPTQGNLYMLCSVDPPGNDPLDVHFVRSTDGGINWSSPVRVNDDAGTTAWQWFGTMSVAPDGRIDVVWLDTRDDPGDLISSLYYSYSTDAGVTWSQNERLSDGFDPHVGWPQQNKLGDYYDMVSDETGAHLAWAATFNGEQDVYYGRISSPVSVDGQTGEHLEMFSLLQNYPNPFNPATAISYQLAAASFVDLRVFDLLGREVATLVNEKKAPGAYRVTWDATGMPSGVYFYRLQAGNGVETRRLVLLR